MVNCLKRAILILNDHVHRSRISADVVDRHVGLGTSTRHTADGKVYLGDQDGDVVVLEFGPKLKVLAKNGMEGAIYSSPVVAGGTLYFTTNTHLFAIGPEKR